VPVDGHDPRDYAQVIEELLSDRERLARLEVGATHQAQQFGWARTAERTLAAYHDATALLGREGLMVAT
jgi:D-inositol-3-phosphate glycosyltransferase